MAKDLSSNWDREVIPPAGHSPGKGPESDLFGMAPQGVVHLQNASFWRELLEL